MKTTFPRGISVRLKMLVVITLLFSCTAGFAQNHPAASARALSGTAFQQSAQSPSAEIPSDCSPCLWTQSAEAQTHKVLYTFTGEPDGGNPYFGGLVLDAAGSLYGTTTVGGPSNLGTVFKLDTTGTETVLHRHSAHFRTLSWYSMCYSAAPRWTQGLQALRTGQLAQVNYLLQI